MNPDNLSVINSVKGNSYIPAAAKRFLFIKNVQISMVDFIRHVIKGSIQVTAITVFGFISHL